MSEVTVQGSLDVVPRVASEAGVTNTLDPHKLSAADKNTLILDVAAKISQIDLDNARYHHAKLVQEC